MLHLIEEHRSPHGLLMFIVEREDDSDNCLGFDGYPWHTHADILASSLGIGETDAVRQFVDDLVGGRAIIGVARFGGEIRDVWVADEPVPDKYKPDDETIEFRYWDGKSVAYQRHNAPNAANGTNHQSTGADCIARCRPPPIACRSPVTAGAIIDPAEQPVPQPD